MKRGEPSLWLFFLSQYHEPSGQLRVHTQNKA